MQQKLYGLDHLRAFAIFFVFLYHYQLPFFGHPEWLQTIAKFGWTGVDLFFVLSGFLISSQLFEEIEKRNTVSLKAFFVKRFFRILPAYWFALCIYFCIPSFHEREALPPLWKFLTFTQNFGTDILNGGTFSHAWSLCVEEHFYVIFPIVLILLLFAGVIRKGYWLLLAFFVAGFAIRSYCWNRFYVPVMNTEAAGFVWYKHIYYPSYGRLDGLLAGIGVAALYRFAPLTWHKISRFGNVSIILGVTLLTTAYFLCEDKQSYLATVFGFPLIAIGYGLIVMGAISSGSVLYKWNSRTMTLIATLSYGIYLLHKGVVHVTQVYIIKLVHVDANSTAMLLICMAASICAAGLLHLIIEKPFMHWRKKMIT